LNLFVLGNHKCLQPANKHGFLHTSNIRRQFRRATDKSHWHHASHSLYSLGDLVLFLTVTFKHRLMNYIARAYNYPNIFRVIKWKAIIWAGHVARMGDRRGVYRVLVGKPKGKRPLGRPRSRREDNIKMDLQEVEWGVGVD